MSTKIYNAYKLEGDYNLTSLNEFCNNLRKEVTKISEQMILDWIVNKTLYYYNFKKLHGSQAVQNMIMQTKNFKEMHEIWKLVDVDRWDSLYWNISDMALERNLQNQRKREIIQIFPLQDKILVMFLEVRIFRTIWKIQDISMTIITKINVRDQIRFLRKNGIYDVWIGERQSVQIMFHVSMDFAWNSLI